MRRFLADLRPWRRPYDWYGIIYALTSAWYPLLHPDCFEVLAQPGPLQTPFGHLAVHLMAALLMFLAPPVLRRRGGRIGRVFGLIYLPLLFGQFYGELAYLGVVFRDYGHSFDPALIDLEQALCGLQPSLAWSRAWPWPWLLELMEFAYFSYYAFAALGLGLIWLASGRDTATRWANSEALVRDLSAVMLTCYAWYTFFPVWGPKYFAYLGVAGSVESEGLRGWVFTDLMRWIHAHGALQGAAFPSSHVAGSLVSWWWGWKVAPRHRGWLTGLWVLLCLSIVYCRYHYVVDLLGGLAWGALIVWLVARFGTAERPPVGGRS
ncbi:MAG: phosphatase PAP2 family protein [Candidatus Krumholzibacteriia bacterium]